MNERNWTVAQIDEMDMFYYFELKAYAKEREKPGAELKKAKRQGNLTPINHVF